MLDSSGLRREISLRLRRGLRHAQNLRDSKRFARQEAGVLLAHPLLRHATPLFRRLKGVDPVLFQNKKVNLGLAIEGLRGIVIRPGQVFSVWQGVGKPSARRGFLPGLGIQAGRAVASVGGGLCQLSNALHWLALHADLKVIERHHHSLDLFPDDHRRIPFGTGATLLYNYKDLRLLNTSPITYQFDFELNDQELIVTLRASEPPPHSYEVLERDHEFLERPEGLFRKNRIVRLKRDARGKLMGEEDLFGNFVQCQYSREECQP